MISLFSSRFRLNSKKPLAFFVLTVLLGVSAKANPENPIVKPTGIASKGISCDFSSILYYPVAHFPMELKSKDSAVVLFGRYWVTPKVIRMEILWTEPCWGYEPSAIPPGLVVIITKDKFSILRAYRGPPKEYSAPFGPRPSADEVMGTWDIDKMRFASSEFQEEDKVNQRRLQDISRFQTKNGSYDQNVRESWEVSDGRLVKLKKDFFSGHKEIAYSYNSGEGRTFLTQQNVFLSEYPIAASGLFSNLKPEEMKYYTNYGIRYHLQGRQNTVNWEITHLDHGDVLVPTDLTVQVLPSTHEGTPVVSSQKVVSPDGKLLAQRQVNSTAGYNAYSELGLHPMRQMKLSEFKEISVPLADLRSDSNVLYCTMSTARIQWAKDVQNRYWYKTMLNSGTNRTELNDLLAKIEEETSPSDPPQEQLRLLYVKIISALILADEKAFPHLVDEYINLLKRAGADEIVQNCLSSLQWTCSEWHRDTFSEIVKKRIEGL